MDTFFEQIIAVKKNGKALAAIIGIWLAAFLLCFVLIMFMGILGTFSLLLAAGTLFGAYKLSVRFNVEYEYILTNGDIDIDKITAKRKRKRMLSFSTKEFEIVAPYKDGQAYTNVLDLGTRSYDNAYYAVFSKDGQKKTLIFNPPQKMIEAMKTYSPRTVHLKGEIENY